MYVCVYVGMRVDKDDMAAAEEKELRGEIRIREDFREEKIEGK